MIVKFVDIGGIVDHYCLNFLFTISIVKHDNPPPPFLNQEGTLYLPPGDVLGRSVG